MILETISGPLLTSKSSCLFCRLPTTSQLGDEPNCVGSSLCIYLLVLCEGLVQGRGPCRHFAYLIGCCFAMMTFCCSESRAFLATKSYPSQIGRVLWPFQHCVQREFEARGPLLILLPRV